MATFVDTNVAVYVYDRGAEPTASRHRIALWDALIVEAAAHGGCDRLLTEDLADGQEIRGLRIENPFRG